MIIAVATAAEVDTAAAADTAAVATEEAPVVVVVAVTAVAGSYSLFRRVVSLSFGSFGSVEQAETTFASPKQRLTV
jgi:spore coat protein U-like protein